MDFGINSRLVSPEARTHFACFGQPWIGLSISSAIVEPWGMLFGVHIFWLPSAKMFFYFAGHFHNLDAAVLFQLVGSTVRADH